MEDNLQLTILHGDHFVLIKIIFFSYKTYNVKDYIREATKKKHFFSGPATKALPPWNKKNTFFGEIFLERQKKLFLLVARPLMTPFYAAF